MILDSSDCLPGIETLPLLFRKSDLTDPARSATLVRYMVERLVESEIGSTIDGKWQPLVDWMAEDPYLQQRILHIAEMVLL